jgi:hypothetical protein
MRQLLVNEVSQKIYWVRNQKVILDTDLASYYGIQTKRLNERIKNNPKRFPQTLVFQLTQNEYENLRSAKTTSSFSHGGRRYLPYAFSLHGATMLACLVNTEQAIQTNLVIIDAFLKSKESENTNREPLSSGNKFIDKIDQVLVALNEINSKIPLPQKKVSNNDILPIQKDSLNFFVPKDEAHCIESPELKIVKQPDQTFRQTLKIEKRYDKAEKIIRFVTQYFELKIQDLKLPSREKSISLPRQIAIYLIRKHTGLILKEIGNLFGGKDHTTIMHACNKIEKEIISNQIVTHAVQFIQKRFLEENNTSFEV